MNDLMAVLGFEDLSKKWLLFGSDEERVGSGQVDGSGGFEDYLVWDTPGFVSLDDLIVNSNGSDHNYQAIGVPPLPKVN